MSEEEEGADITLLQLNRVFAFRIPPRTASTGYKAADWNKEPLWKGRLALRQHGDQVIIALEHTDKPGLFAACPLVTDPSKPPSVEPVTDSSRYFVLRLEDGKGKTAYIGIGFNNRDDAFEFKVAIRDSQSSAEAEKEVKEKDKQPSKDYSLKGKIVLGKDLSKKKETAPADPDVIGSKAAVVAKDKKPKKEIQGLSLDKPAAASSGRSRTRGKPAPKKEHQEDQEEENDEDDDILGIEKPKPKPKQ
jgi:hypothetical protein